MLTLFRGGTLVVKICIDMTALTELVWWMKRKRISSAAVRSLTCLEDKDPFSLSLFFFFFFFFWVASEWVGVLSPLTFANPLLRNSIGWFCCRVERQVVAKQTGRCTPLYLRVCKVSGGTSLWTACRSCRLQWCTRTSAFPARRLFLPTYPCTASVFWYFYTAVHPCSWLGIEYQLLTYNSYSLPGCIVHPWPHLSIRRIIPFRIIFLREETPTKICGRCW